MNKNFCSPEHKKFKQCYSNEIINNFIKEKKIKDINIYMKNKGCKNEKCWHKINNSFFKKSAIKPKSMWDTKGDEAYLISDYEINEVLKQYKKDFLITDLDMNNLANKTFTKTGLVIFCNGKNYKYADHWVGILIDEKQRKITYFDSENIKDLKMIILPKIINIIKKKYKILEYNNIDIQIDKINCGIFVIDFIVSLWNDINYEKWLKNFQNKKNTLSKKEYIDYLTNLRSKYFII
jgi:hypothetical protein